MKHLLCSVVTTLLLAQGATANNIQVANTTLIDNGGGMATIRFDISWENSWRGGGAANWDAAWVFAKYRLGDGTWHHLHPENSGHTSPGGITIATAPENPYALSSDTNAVVGVFLHRSANGYGDLNATGVQLLWDHASQGVGSLMEVKEVRVFAVEMVYVNGGTFHVGGTPAGDIYTSPDINSSYTVSSEAAINVGTTNGHLYYPEGSGHSGDRSGPIPAAFPKGFTAFYAMKYEVSQQGYVDFLNTLTHAQQATRTATAPGSAAGTGALSSTNEHRNGIDISTPGVDPGTPAVYACNLSGDGVYGGPDDGQDIACNHLSIGDLLAYLDWSALRPMTELEFEKACRGPVAPVANEYDYPWGSTARAESYYTLSNVGTANEGIAMGYSLTNGNAVYLNTAVWIDGPYGPVRVGAFAANAGNTGRVSSGASYYGIMELGGNVHERAITIGHPGGRGYAGTHGNGVPAANGDADPFTWSAAAAFTGHRGGGWDSEHPKLYTSARGQVNVAQPGRYANSGGRGVRTAP